MKMEKYTKNHARTLQLETTISVTVTWLGV